MRLRSEKEVVECEKALAIAQARFRDCDWAYAAMAIQHSVQRRGDLGGKEWEQDSVKSFGIRVHGHDGLASNVFSSVSDQSVLAQCDDNIFW
jgi:hypothetical protein